MINSTLMRGFEVNDIYTKMSYLVDLKNKYNLPEINEICKKEYRSLLAQLPPDEMDEFLKIVDKENKDNVQQKKEN